MSIPWKTNQFLPPPGEFDSSKSLSPPSSSQYKNVYKALNEALVYLEKSAGLAYAAGKLGFTIFTSLINPLFWYRNLMVLVFLFLVYIVLTKSSLRVAWSVIAAPYRFFRYLRETVISWFYDNDPFQTMTDNACKYFVADLQVLSDENASSEMKRLAAQDLKLQYEIMQFVFDSTDHFSLRTRILQTYQRRLLAPLSRAKVRIPGIGVGFRFIPESVMKHVFRQNSIENSIQQRVLADQGTRGKEPKSCAIDFKFRFKVLAKQQRQKQQEQKEEPEPESEAEEEEGELFEETAETAETVEQNIREYEEIRNYVEYVYRQHVVQQRNTRDEEARFKLMDRVYTRYRQRLSEEYNDLRELFEGVKEHEQKITRRKFDLVKAEQTLQENMGRVARVFTFIDSTINRARDPAESYLSPAQRNDPLVHKALSTHDSVGAIKRLVEQMAGISGIQPTEQQPTWRELTEKYQNNTQNLTNMTQFVNAMKETSTQATDQARKIAERAKDIPEDFIRLRKFYMNASKSEKSEMLAQWGSVEIFHGLPKDFDQEQFLRKVRTPEQLEAGLGLESLPITPRPQQQSRWRIPGIFSRSRRSTVPTQRRLSFEESDEEGEEEEKKRPR